MCIPVCRFADERDPKTVHDGRRLDGTHEQYKELLRIENALRTAQARHRHRLDFTVRKLA